MKLYKWKTIKRKIEKATEEDTKEQHLTSFEEIIKIMKMHSHTSSSLSSSDARIQIDSEHNKGYNK